MPSLPATRRSFLGAAAACALTRRIAFARTAPLRIGVIDWNLNLGADPDAVSKAAELGFQGVQGSFGRNLTGGKMPADRPEVIPRYLQLSQKHGVAIDGTCVDRLHDNGLKSDPLALKWVLDAIRLTSALRARVLLLPFFGKWAIESPSERDAVGDALREIAPEAEKAIGRGHV